MPATAAPGGRARYVAQPPQPASVAPAVAPDEDCARPDGQSLHDWIRASFSDCCGCDPGAGGKRATPEALGRYLLRAAELGLALSGQSLLTGMDKQAVALAAVRLMQDMDLQGLGHIGLDAWTHHMLVQQSGSELRDAALPAVNALLSKALQHNSCILGDLQRMFELADRSCSGFLDVQDIEAAYRQRIWRLRPEGIGLGSLSDEELEMKEPRSFAKLIMQSMDVDGDERVSYLEFVAFLLGRRKQEVYLHLYDLSKGAAQAVAPWMLGHELEGVWHTGTVVFGREYHYARDTVHGAPGDTSFGEPTRKVHVGFTLWHKEDFHHFINTELKPVFQRETYDVVCNNCNHFTDRVCMWLVGRHPPEEVMRQPEVLMGSLSVRTLRPVLNWWLRERIVVRDPSNMPKAAPAQPLAVTKEQPAVASLVEARPNGCSTPILGQVAMPPLGPAAPVCAAWGEDWKEQCTQVQLPDCGCCSHGEGPTLLGPCNPMWPEGSLGELGDSGCGARASKGPPPAEGVWVQYFGLALDPAEGCRGKVCTELLPCTQVTPASLRDGRQETYARAFSAINSPCQLAPPKRKDWADKPKCQVGVSASTSSCTDPVSPQLPLDALANSMDEEVVSVPIAI